MARVKTKKRNKFLWLAVLIALMVGGFATYKHISIAMNKRDFQNARIAINKIYSKVIGKVSRPDNAVAESFCSRSHKEFSKGDLSCDINTNFIYGVDNEEIANQLLNSIQGQISSVKEFKSVTPINKSLKDYNVVSNIYHTASANYNVGSLRCVINYVYDTPREIDLTIKDNSKKPFEITIGCYGPAKQQYYRLAS